MDKLISVIVPIYKVEEYLPKCLDSIICQTYKNLEIILVNDGSPDNCPYICDEYAKRDSRIKVIHQKNAGLSAARNSGLDIATGNYVAFVDSDDFIHEKMYEIMMHSLIKENADIAVCGYLSKSEPIKEEDWKIGNADVFCNTGLQAMENLYAGKDPVGYFAWSACNKLYSRTIFDNIRYPVGKICEDSFIIHYIFEQAENVVYINERLYFYSVRDSSIMHTEVNANWRDEIEALEERIHYFKEKGYKELNLKATEHCLNVMMQRYVSISKVPELSSIKMEVFNKFKEIYEELIDKTNLQMKTVVKCMIFNFNPNMYSLIWSLKKQ